MMRAIKGDLAKSASSTDLRRDDDDCCLSHFLASLTLDLDALFHHPMPTLCIARSPGPSPQPAAPSAKQPHIDPYAHHCPGVSRILEHFCTGKKNERCVTDFERAAKQMLCKLKKIYLGERIGLTWGVEGERASSQFAHPPRARRLPLRQTSYRRMLASVTVLQTAGGAPHCSNSQPTTDLSTRCAGLGYQAQERTITVVRAKSVRATIQELDKRLLRGTVHCRSERERNDEGVGRGGDGVDSHDACLPQTLFPMPPFNPSLLNFLPFGPVDAQRLPLIRFMKGRFPEECSQSNGAAVMYDGISLVICDDESCQQKQRKEKAMSDGSVSYQRSWRRQVIGATDAR
ncbi:hypothetical protein K488DRAFT_75085 [Vararia minispora EC-137]|uniref:Uncharacterized protein n=1 Tax=Vararia minispora EC-137 TaxID=1314806 RepID=A0ACB8Q4Y5_9AGAM|nr:hypothetical protein K488DRAFT_75085 [Vararia minispora EC-137]